MAKKSRTEPESKVIEQLLSLPFSTRIRKDELALLEVYANRPNAEGYLLDIKPDGRWVKEAHDHLLKLLAFNGKSIEPALMLKAQRSLMESQRQERDRAERPRLRTLKSL